MGLRAVDDRQLAVAGARFVYRRFRSVFGFRDLPAYLFWSERMELDIFPLRSIRREDLSDSLLKTSDACWKFFAISAISITRGP